MRYPRGLPVVALGLALVWAGAARAQGSARSLDFDPSVRATGMGGASSAVFWDGANAWANPALLGYERGLRYEWGKTPLIPELVEDVEFRTHVVKLGGGGFGVVLAGKPGIGGITLDYGTSEGTDDQGNPTDLHHAFEDVEAWGFGVSVGRLAEVIAGWLGHDAPALSRFGDLSLGAASKDVEMDLFPGASGQGESSASDLGLLVRLSPLEWFGPTREAAVDLDLAYGWSHLSRDGRTIGFGAGFVAPPAEHRRSGFAVRAGVRWPEAPRAGLERLGWLAAGLEPMLSVAAAFDHDDYGPEASGFEVNGGGLELGFANVVALRFGSYEDNLEAIDASTVGWSVGLPVGRLGGVRYDRSRLPQIEGLAEPDRNAFTVWMDPLEVWSIIDR